MKLALLSALALCASATSKLPTLPSPPLHSFLLFADLGNLEGLRALQNPAVSLSVSPNVPSLGITAPTTRRQMTLQSGMDFTESANNPQKGYIFTVGPGDQNGRQPSAAKKRMGRKEQQQQSSVGTSLYFADAVKALKGNKMVPSLTQARIEGRPVRAGWTLQQ